MGLRVVYIKHFFHELLMQFEMEKCRRKKKSSYCNIFAIFNILEMEICLCCQYLFFSKVLYDRE